MPKSTEDHKKYWSERKIDWKKSYLDTYNHPHRELIIWALKKLNWYSLWEIGCGPGANLVKIVQHFKAQLGGSDVNENAIKLAREVFVGGRFHVESCEDMLISDKSVDIVLSDATLIYIDPKKIDKVMHEVSRITRNGIVFCEFHSSNWLKRFLFRRKTGYNAYNYQKLLDKYGFYDIEIYKIPRAMWPGTPWEEWGHIIIAKKIKRI